MRSSEFITESSAEDQELIVLSRKLGDYIKALIKPKGTFSKVASTLVGPMFDDLFKFNNIGLPIKNIVTPSFNEPKINEIVNKVELCNATLRADELSDSLGAFGLDGSIYLNIPLFDNIDEIYTVLIHELRHALDWCKRPSKHNQSHSGTTHLPKEKYLINQDELNARFTQAILDINNDMPADISQLPNIIIKHFSTHRLIEIFPDKKNDPRYKQLVKRAVKFFEAQQEVITKPQQSFIRRAINYITAGIL